MNHSPKTTYEPEVDDYVIWNRPNGDVEEGWVYFKGDPIDNEKRIKDGWKVLSRYITIETSVRDKPTCMYSSGKPMRHKNIHTLLFRYAGGDDCPVIRNSPILVSIIMLNCMTYDVV